jgi:hypothetical protein
MNPFQSLLKSRKFLLLVLDTAISLILWAAGLFLPQYAEQVNQLILILQPVIIAVITGIAIEDAAAKRGGSVG